MGTRGVIHVRPLGPQEDTHRHGGVCCQPKAVPGEAMGEVWGEKVWKEVGDWTTGDGFAGAFCDQRTDRMQRIEQRGTYSAQVYIPLCSVQVPMSQWMLTSHM